MKAALIITGIVLWLGLMFMIWALLAAASIDARIAELTEEIHE